jgi:hypothetical protein
VFDRIIKLDGPRSAFPGDHTSKTDGTEKRVRGGERKIREERAGGDEDENEGKILLVWSVNKTRKASRKSFQFVSLSGAEREAKYVGVHRKVFAVQLFHFSWRRE